MSKRERENFHKGPLSPADRETLLHTLRTTYDTPTRDTTVVIFVGTGVEDDDADEEILWFLKHFLEGRPLEEKRNHRVLVHGEARCREVFEALRAMDATSRGK